MKFENEREITKEEILRKYKKEIMELTDNVFRAWTALSIPLVLKITKEEGLTYLEAEAILDTLMVETIRDLVDRHRTGEKRRDEE
ncbi:MAG: hypothetical protein GXO43_02285 [Crenarchaeota archaeon]|nr:hypothetical protein [Thermoproteota archaeon]